MINTDTSRVTVVKVDPVVPFLDVKSPIEGSLIDGRVLFDIDVSEEVKLSYSLEYEEGCSSCRTRGGMHIIGPCAG